MNAVIVMKIFKLLFRAVNLLIGVLLLSLSLNHVFNAGVSLLATGVPLLGLFQLPPLPEFVAVLVGILIFPKAVLMILGSLIPRKYIRQIRMKE